MTTTTVGVLFLVDGLVIFLLSLPLVYRKVPMNKLYGVRIRRAFESEQRWYDINAYGGRQLARWSWLIVAAGVAGFFVPSKHTFAYTMASLGAVLLAVLVPFIQVLVWSRKRAA